MAKSKLKPVTTPSASYPAGNESAQAEELVGTTMPCPQHGEDHPLTIQREDTPNGVRIFAVCHCVVRNNMFKDRVVWEQTFATIQEETVLESTEGV